MARYYADGEQVSRTFFMGLLEESMAQQCYDPSEFECIEPLIALVGGEELRDIYLPSDMEICID